MRKVKEVLRLKYDCQLTERQIAQSCGISHSTVADYLKRAASAGISYMQKIFSRHFRPSGQS
ncbi:MAG: sigma factor-like helix-turn-helix DNA-binding protein [Endomicrobiales bacterium]